MKFSNLLKKPLLLIAGILAVTVVAETVPTTEAVKVKSFTYDGSTLAGQIYVSARISTNPFNKHNAKYMLSTNRSRTLLTPRRLL